MTAPWVDSLEKRLLNQDQGKVVPPAIGLFAGVDLKAVMPGSLKHIDAAGFHHGPDPELV